MLILSQKNVSRSKIYYLNKQRLDKFDKFIYIFI